MKKENNTNTSSFKTFQKQLPDVFCMKNSQKFHKIHRKAPVSDSFSIQLAGNFIKKESLTQVFS